MKIEKSIEIGRSSSAVYDFLKITKNQDKFSVWNMADPAMNKQYRGVDGNVGFVYAWDSTNKNVGAGEQQITAMDEGKSIEYSIRFFRPMQNTGTTRFLISGKDENSSRVVWTFEAPSRFPMVLLSPIFKQMLGKDLGKGLNNLKNILEKS